jgi:hypothetical protein
MSTVNYPFTGLERKSMTFSPVLDGNGLHLPDEVEHRRAALVSADHQQRRQPGAEYCRCRIDIFGGINLLNGVFTSTTMIWREKNGQIEVTS